MPGTYVSSRGAVAIGQRFYYLEIAGARPITVATARRRRAQPSAARAT